MDIAVNHQHAFGRLGYPLIDQKRLSLIPLQLALSPVVGLPIRIELANVVTVQCLHDDPREHRRASVCRDQDQRFHCRLPLRRVVLSLRKLRDVFAGILQRDKLAAAGQRYWLVGPRGPGH